MSPLDAYAGNPDSVAYDSAKGEVFLTCAFGGVQVISDSNNAVVAYFRTGLAAGGIAYDSGKGEIFVGDYSNALSILSDSASSSASTNPTSSPTTLPSPTVPEFSSEMFVSVAAAMVIVTLCAVGFSRKKIRISP